MLMGFVFLEVSLCYRMDLRAWALAQSAKWCPFNRPWVSPWIHGYLRQSKFSYYNEIVAGKKKCAETRLNTTEISKTIL